MLSVHQITDYHYRWVKVINQQRHCRYNYRLLTQLVRSEHALARLMK